MASLFCTHLSRMILVIFVFRIVSNLVTLKQHVFELKYHYEEIGIFRAIKDVLIYCVGLLEMHRHNFRNIYSNIKYERSKLFHLLPT